MNDAPIDRKHVAAEIIHGYAAAHAAVALTLANTVIGDTPILTTLTFSMIDDLGRLYGLTYTWRHILRKCLQLFAAQIGVYFAAKVVTWIPWAGNLVNASMVFGMTETIGWTIYHLYENGNTLDTATAHQVKTARAEAQHDRQDYARYQHTLEHLPTAVRQEYAALATQLAQPGLSEQQKRSLAVAMKTLVHDAVTRNETPQPE